MRKFTLLVALTAVLLLLASGQCRAQTETSSNDLAAIHAEYEAARIHLEAIEKAAFRWGARAIFTEQREDEVKRLRHRVERQEELYVLAYKTYLQHRAAPAPTNAVSYDSAFITNELSRLDEVIRQAEDDVAEYKRLHDLVSPYDLQNKDVSGEVLRTLERRKAERITRMSIMEAEYPQLTNALPRTLESVRKLDKETFDAVNQHEAGKK